MHWDNPNGAWGDLRFDLFRINRKCVSICIAEHHATTRLRNCFRGRNPRMRSGDHLVARLDFETLHQNIKGISTVGTTDAVIYAHGSSEFAFKVTHKSATNKCRFSNNSRNRLINFRLDRKILCV